MVLVLVRRQRCSRWVRMHPYVLAGLAADWPYRLWPVCYVLGRCLGGALLAEEDRRDR